MLSQSLRNLPPARPYANRRGALLIATCLVTGPFHVVVAQDTDIPEGIGLPTVPSPGTVSETPPAVAGQAPGADPGESVGDHDVDSDGPGDEEATGDDADANAFRLPLPPGADSTPQNMLLAAYEAFVAFYENDDHGKAQEAGQLVVEFTEAQHGPDALELVTPLANLAIVQLELDLLPQAQANYERAISIVESADGIFSELLISPLTGLGLTQRKAGEYEASISTLQRAKNITHRNQGLMNLEQIDIVEMLTESYMGAREFREADREQRFALQVNERRFGPDSPDLVPALYRLADWFKRTGQYVPARNIYRRSVEILENHYGESDLRLSEALRGVAVTYHLQGVRRSEGARALQRAVSLYEEAQSVDALDHAGALVSLGDWYIQTGKNRQAVETYQRAWRLLTDEDGGSTDRARGVLGVPVRLRYYPPQPESGPASWSAEDFASRFVDVEFTVTDRGRVVEAQVVSANAPNRVKQQVRQAVLNARYRPRFVEGEAVETPGVRLRQTFFSSE